MWDLLVIIIDIRLLILIVLQNAVQNDVEANYMGKYVECSYDGTKATQEYTKGIFPDSEPDGCSQHCYHS